MTFNKAIVAFLGAGVTLAAALGLHVDWITPEVIGTVGTVITGILTYLIPNAVKS